MVYHLGIKATKYKGRAYLSPEQLHILDEYHNHLKQGGRMNTFILPENIIPGKSSESVEASTEEETQDIAVTPQLTQSEESQIVAVIPEHNLYIKKSELDSCRRVLLRDFGELTDEELIAIALQAKVKAYMSWKASIFSELYAETDNLNPHFSKYTKWLSNWLNQQRWVRKIIK
jgi:hypothetical protein